MQDERLKLAAKELQTWTTALAAQMTVMTSRMQLHSSEENRRFYGETCTLLERTRAVGNLFLEMIRRDSQSAVHPHDVSTADRRIPELAARQDQNLFTLVGGDADGFAPDPNTLQAVKFYEKRIVGGSALPPGGIEVKETGLPKLSKTNRRGHLPTLHVVFEPASRGLGGYPSNVSWTHPKWLLSEEHMDEFIGRAPHEREGFEPSAMTREEREILSAEELRLRRFVKGIGTAAAIYEQGQAATPGIETGADMGTRSQEAPNRRKRKHEDEEDEEDELPSVGTPSPTPIGDESDDQQEENSEKGDDVAGSDGELLDEEDRKKKKKEKPEKRRRRRGDGEPDAKKRRKKDDDDDQSDRDDHKDFPSDARGKMRGNIDLDDGGGRKDEEEPTYRDEDVKEVPRDRGISPFQRRRIERKELERLEAERAAASSKPTPRRPNEFGAYKLSMHD